MERLEEVIAIASGFAAKNGCEVINLDSERKRLIRVKDGKESYYEGPTRGIQFHPDENCDPFVLEFDRDLYIQQFCKTQFAGISTHVEVIQLLRKIEPHFETFDVMDEGDFWKTSDITLLEKKFEPFSRRPSKWRRRTQS